MLYLFFNFLKWILCLLSSTEKLILCLIYLGWIPCLFFILVDPFYVLSSLKWILYLFLHFLKCSLYNVVLPLSQLDTLFIFLNRILYLFSIARVCILPLSCLFLHRIRLVLFHFSSCIPIRFFPPWSEDKTVPVHRCRRLFFS